jgi:hypothetical protein
MTVKLTIELPDALERKAREQGLLEPDKLTRLIKRELALDEPMEDFRRMVEAMRSYPDDEPMTMDEIQTEVNAVRAERRKQRESRR